MDILEIIEQVKSEEKSALLVLKDLKDFYKMLKEEIDIVQEMALNEAEHYETHFNLHGFAFEKRNGRTMYDYSKIEEVIKAKENLKEVELKYKGAYIQSQKGIIGVTKEDGEVLQLPKVTQTNQVLIIKHQK